MLRLLSLLFQFLINMRQERNYKTVYYMLLTNGVDGHFRRQMKVIVRVHIMYNKQSGYQKAQR